jgi:hypothetical protein
MNFVPQTLFWLSHAFHRFKAFGWLRAALNQPSRVALSTGKDVSKSQPA